MAGEGFSKGGQAAVSILSAAVQVISVVVMVLMFLGVIRPGIGDAKAAAQGAGGHATAAQVEALTDEVRDLARAVDARVRVLENDKIARDAVVQARGRKD